MSVDREALDDACRFNVKRIRHDLKAAEGSTIFTRDTIDLIRIAYWRLTNKETNKSERQNHPRAFQPEDTDLPLVGVNDGKVPESEQYTIQEIWRSRDRALR